jgi:hypothetical protein
VDFTTGHFVLQVDWPIGPFVMPCGSPSLLCRKCLALFRQARI